MPIDATDGPRNTKAGAPVEPKTFASGRFVVQRLLGEGGQKTVYLARDTQLDRDVAIAAIKTHGLDEAGIARVRREAQTLAGLGAQPQIVTMYDIGQEQGPDGLPVPYFVCEYIAGGDLEHQMRRFISRIGTIATATLAVCLFLVARASSQEPSISISPESGPCGTLVNVTGTGFPPQTDLLVEATFVRDGGGFEGAPPTTRTDVTGSFSATVRIPIQGCPWPRGVNVFACVHLTCKPAARVAFTVTDGLPAAGTGAPSSANPFHSTAVGLAFFGAFLVVLSSLQLRFQRRTIS